MISDQEIQETFYNTMLDVMFSGELSRQNSQHVKHNLTDSNLRGNFTKAIVMDTFCIVLSQSRLAMLPNGQMTLEVPSIKGNIITSQNVSPQYQNLFSALVVQYQSKSVNMLSSIVDSTMQLGTFNTMIESVIRFYLSGQSTSK